jgi:hypothetical protein
MHKSKHYFSKLRENKRKLKLVILSGGQCKLCGYNKCLHALSFHHLNPKTKNFNINTVTCRAKNWDLLLKELQKCIVLCLNCHMELHHKPEDKIAYQTKCRRRYKQKFITMFNNKCSVCNYNKCNDALDFHHIDSNNKKMNIQFMLNRYSLKKIEEEIKKCILICKNCHNELHAKIDNSYTIDYLLGEINK